MRILVLVLATSGYDQVYRRNIESLQRYAERHGYACSIVSGDDRTQLGRQITWLKVPLLLGALATGYDAVLFCDSDVQAADDAAPVSEVLDAYPDHAIFMANGHSGRPNSGVILCRNVPAATTLLRTVLRSSGSIVPPKSHVGWGDNGYFIHALENEPSFQTIDRVWNNTEELDGRSHFYHFTGPLRAQYQYDAGELRARDTARLRDRRLGDTAFIDRHRFLSELMTGYRTAREGREVAFSPFDPAWLVDEDPRGTADKAALHSSGRRIHLCVDEPRPDGPNPYAGQLETHLAARAEVLTGVGPFWTMDYAGIDVLHLQWVEALTGWNRPDAAQLDAISARLAAIARTTRIVMTVHNLHLKADFGDMALALMDVVGRHVSAFVHLSAASVSVFKATYAGFPWVDKPVFVIGHGNYDNYFDQPARPCSFQLPQDPYVLIFGAIRTVAELALAEDVAAAMRAQGVPVVMAGQVGGALMEPEEKSRLHHLSDALTTRFHWRVPAADVPAIFAGARVVFLPRIDRLNSGVQYLAYTFLKPVVAPATATMGAVQAEVAGVTFEPGASAAIAAVNKVLRMTPGETVRQMERIRRFKATRMDWDRIADQHMESYAAILNRAVI